MKTLKGIRIMNIKIQKGEIKFMKDCKEALANSELGKRYFKKEGSIEEDIVEGLDRGSLYVAIYNETCVGFIYYIPEGAFHAFPYLHLMAVKS